MTVSKSSSRVSVPSGLRCRVRLADGRVFTGELPPERHRALQLGLLHAHGDGLVEIAAGERRDGRLAIITRPRADKPARADHFVAGGATGGKDWLGRLLALVERHARLGREVFAAPALRSTPHSAKTAVAHTRVLWVDIDQPGQLHHLWALLAEKPCHLLVQTAGSGGVHAYWRLTRQLPSQQAIDGLLIEPIERAHTRLIHRLGVDARGKPNVADPQCSERSRVMRVAGTINKKTGRYARIVEADFQLAPYTIEALVGDLPDPTPPRPASNGARPSGPLIAHEDPYKRIAPPDYFHTLAGIDMPARGGLVRCPNPNHPDQHPSCSVGTDSTQGWLCHSCGAGGAIYDLASILLGGPTGRELRGDAFRRAHDYVADIYGENP